LEANTSYIGPNKLSEPKMHRLMLSALLGNQRLVVVIYQK